MAMPHSEVYGDPIKTQLKEEDNFYFSAIVFTIWDNIYGPRVMRIWQNPVTGKEPTSHETLSAVATYTLTGEACRNGKLEEVETKLYCLSDKGIVATAFLFTVYHGKYSDLFSLLLVLPYSELSEWLGRHILLCDKMKDILNTNLIPHITTLYAQPSFKAVPSQFEKALLDFVNISADYNTGSLSTKAVMYQLYVASVLPKDLTGFVELAYCLRNYCLPDPEHLPLTQTFFGTDLSKDLNFLDFLKKAITSHLETNCYTIVIGKNSDHINKMMKTLSYFMSLSERRLSCLLTPDTQLLPYIKDLYVQGFIQLELENAPVKYLHLKLSPFSPTLIDMNNLTVHQAGPPEVHQYFRNQYKSQQRSPNQFHPDHHADTTFGYEMQQFMTSTPHSNIREDDLAKKSESAQMVKDFFDKLVQLPIGNGSRESYISQFVRLLYRKAYALHHYVENEHESAHWLAAGESVLNLKRLMNDLSIHDNADLRVILGMASKIDSHIIGKVLGDQSLPAVEFAQELRTV